MTNHARPRLRGGRWLLRLLPVFISIQLWPSVTPALAQPSTASKCTPAERSDTHPWDHNYSVLAAFPPDVPLPVFRGRFGDSNRAYELDLWRDRAGVFGQWMSPVLDADSPVSRLYNLTFDAKSGAIRFETRIPGSEQRFDGVLRADVVRGTSTLLGGKKETIELRKLPLDSLGMALRDGTTSRAQFDCEMVLFRRY
jgi:hypothetical protein